MESESQSYQSSLCSFRYPKGWTLRESKGTKDVYTQVHVFGELNKDLGFGPSITLTVYPAKEAGGKFSSAAELAKDRLQKTGRLSGYKLESQTKATLASGTMAEVYTVSYVLRLPLYQVNTKDVTIREETFYFEKGGQIFVLSYKNIAEDFISDKPAFREFLDSF
ncbi:MAG: hypothetical protein WC732_08190 [Candidatus Omnitrophota bacterium]